MGGVDGPAEQVGHALERDRQREHGEDTGRPGDVRLVERAAAQEQPDREPADHDEQDRAPTTVRTVIVARLRPKVRPNVAPVATAN